MTAPAAEVTTADIRRWARDQGMDVPVRGPLPPDVRSAWHTAMAGPDDDQPPAGVFTRGEQPGGDGATVVFGLPGDAPGAGEGSQPPDLDPAADDGAAEAGPRERPPQPAGRPGLRERVTRVRDRARGEGRPARRGRPPKRVSAASLGESAWSGAALGLPWLTSRAPVQRFTRGANFAPVSAILQFQAPAAGLVIEDEVRGTPADRYIQPLARAWGYGDKIGAMVGLPAAAAVICMRPELYPVMFPRLVRWAQEYVVLAGPKIRAARKREEAFQAEMAALGEELGDFNIESWLQAAFAPLFSQEPPAGGVNGYDPGLGARDPAAG